MYFLAFELQANAIQKRINNQEIILKMYSFIKSGKWPFCDMLQIRPQLRPGGNPGFKCGFSRVGGLAGKG